MMSQAAIPIDTAMHNAERYWYEDGFENMFWGILLLAGLIFPFGVGPHDSTHFFLRLVSGYLVALSFLILHRRVIGWLKSRITYPRTGYAAPPPSAIGIKRHDTGFWPAPFPTPAEEEYLDRHETLEKWKFVCLIAIFILAHVHAEGINRWLVLAIAVFFGVVAKYSQAPGNAAWATFILAVIVGLATAFSPIPNDWRFQIMLVLFGGISLVIGVCRLVIFLHHRPSILPTVP